MYYITIYNNVQISSTEGASSLSTSVLSGDILASNWLVYSRGNVRIVPVLDQR